MYTQTFSGMTSTKEEGEEEEEEEEPEALQTLW